MTIEELRKPCVISFYLRCKTHGEHAAMGDDRCLRAEAFDLGLAAGQAEIERLRSYLSAVVAHPAEEAEYLRMTAREGLKGETNVRTLGRGDGWASRPRRPTRDPSKIA